MRRIITELPEYFQISNRSFSLLEILCDTKRSSCTAASGRNVGRCLISLFGKAGIMIFNQCHLIDHRKFISLFIVFIKLCLLYRMSFDIQQSLLYPYHILII